MNRFTIAVAAIAIIAVAALVWSFAERARLSIQVAFADEQTEVFDQMTVKALDALDETPPDVASAVDYLGYIHNYYPSGTKQTKGSQLDVIVERIRSIAELRIIEMLRVATGKRLDDVGAWIEAYSDQPDSSE